MSTVEMEPQNTLRYHPPLRAYFSEGLLQVDTKHATTPVQ